MANNLTKSIFLPGGRTIFPETNEISKGLKLTKNGDKWRLTIDIEISALEAKDVIRTFDSFAPVPPGSTFDQTYQNQVYFEAFDDAGASKDIGCKNIQMNVFFNHKSEDLGEINLRFTPEFGISKTQSAKTQSATT